MHPNNKEFNKVHPSTASRSATTNPRARRLNKAWSATLALLLSLAVLFAGNLPEAKAATNLIPGRTSNTVQAGSGPGMTAVNWYNQGSQRDKWFGARPASLWNASSAQAPTGQVYCVEMGPQEGSMNWSTPTAPNTAYLLWLGEQNPNNQRRAAVQTALYRYAFPALQDNFNMQRLANTLPASDDISVLAQQMWNEAQQRSGPYWINDSGGLAFNIAINAGGQTGQVQNVGIRNSEGWVPGFTGTLTLIGPAEFTNGSTSRSITTTSSAQNFNIRSTGNGNVYARMVFNNLPNTQYSRGSHPSNQDAAAVLNPTSLTQNTDTSPMSMSFQPVVSTEVVNERVQVGQRLQDRVTFSAQGSNGWTIDEGAFIPVNFQYAIYGPYDTPQAPQNWAAGTTPVFQGWTDYTRTGGPGTATVSSTNTISSGGEGFYYWVWRVRTADQPTQYRPNVEGNWTDRAWLRAETTVVPHSPSITSQIQDGVYRNDESGAITDEIVQSGFGRTTRWTGSNGWSGDNLVTHTLYGPYAQRPTDSTSTPASMAVQSRTTNPVNGTFNVSFDPVDDPGWYVVRSQLAQSPRLNSVHTSAGDQNEQFGVRFSPSITTEVLDQVVTPDSENRTTLVDVITPESSTGTWPVIQGNPVQVNARGHLYGPLDEKPEQTPEIPEDAPLAGSVEAVLNGQPQNISMDVEGSGWYTWVWEILEEDQTAAVNELLYGLDWRDEYGIEVETSLVTWPTNIHSTQDRHAIGYEQEVIDWVTLEGFPEDHGRFELDNTEVSHHLIGPFPDERPTDDLDLEDHRDLIIETVITNTSNGEHEVTFEFPEELGFYVVVTEYTGDFRTEPFVTSLGDVLEQVSVVRVTTQAVEHARLGEPIHDVAFVEGNVPEGSALTFELWQYNFNADGTLGDVEDDILVHTTESIEVNEAGEYISPEFTPTDPARYYWREILDGPEDPTEPEEPTDPEDPEEPTDPEEEPRRPRIHYGDPRLPNETTHVVQVTTTAVHAVAEGDNIFDVAHVEGSVPEGSQLVFELWRYVEPTDDGIVEEDEVIEEDDNGTEELGNGNEDEDGTLPEDEEDVEAPEPVEPDPARADELVYTTGPVDVDGPGFYTSPEVENIPVGKYYWREILYGSPTEEDPETGETPDRPVVHYGDPRLPNETTYIVRVTTEAQSSDDVLEGETVDVWDTITVEGEVPEDGLDVTAELYKWEKGSEPVCEDPIWTASITRVYEPGTFDTEKYTLDPVEDVVYGFVEVTYDRDGREISRGICGEASETLEAEESSGSGGPWLPQTGANSVGLILLALGLVAGGWVTFRLSVRPVRG